MHANHRKKGRNNKNKPKKSYITKKDKIYGILAMVTILMLGAIFYFFVVKDILYK